MFLLPISLIFCSEQLIYVFKNKLSVDAKNLLELFLAKLI